MAELNNIVTASVTQEEFGIFKTTIVEYNGNFENASASNKAGMTSLNLGQFDRLRSQLASQGIDKFGCQLIAKEMLKLVKTGTFTFNEISNIASTYAVAQGGFKFTQAYLDSLNANRATTSRLDLIGDEIIPTHVNRAIIY